MSSYSHNMWSYNYFEKSDTVFLQREHWKLSSTVERYTLLTEISKNQTKTKIIDLSFITIRLFYCYTFSLMTTDIDIKLHLCRHISPSFSDFVFREIIISWGLVEWITFCLFRRQVFWCIHGTSQNSTASPRRSCFPACSTGWLVDIFSWIGQNTNG